MTTSNKCSMCANTKRSGTCLCAGCKSYFCRRHFKEHHNGLLNELNIYIEERNSLQEQISRIDLRDDSSKNVLLQIDEWQRTMIDKVMQVAEQARQQVKLLCPKRAELTLKLAQFSNRIVHLKETEDLVEDDLKQLKETVQELKQELKLITEPMAVELSVEQSEHIAWDSLISVKKKPVTTNRNRQYISQSNGKNVFFGYYQMFSANRQWTYASPFRNLSFIPTKIMKSGISRVLIMGAGPTGLLMGCLMRDQGIPVTILEKREEMTRTRCVKLLGGILSTDELAGGIHLFTENQIEERQKAIESIESKLFTKLTSWLELCTPLQTIQQSLKEYFTSSGGQISVGAQYDMSKNLESLRHYSDTLIVDCTGYHSVLRNHIQPDNLLLRFVEYVLICTFTFDDRYECNELCKFYKNRNTRKFRVIPAIDDTYRTGKRQTLVTCLITIDDTIFRQMPKRESLTYNYLKKHHCDIYDDLNIFLNNLSSEQTHKIHFDTMEFIALPLQVYRAKKMTHSFENQELNQHWVLLGDAAMGGPYFQSISMGYEAAIYLAYLLKHTQNDMEQMMSKYECYMEKLWLALQIRSKEIQRNKQILQYLCANDRNAILEKIKVY
ncbi:hypothetical protein I4U23_019880 [Adineta vaga]|nr:hypothetical protein I4U23_019880 [Adineta vaga]